MGNLKRFIILYVLKFLKISFVFIIIICNKGV